MFKSKGPKLALILVGVLAASLTWAVLGLTRSVKVVYDDHGIPTIRAKTELDAIYTLGYLHAKDRFFQMDVQRRAFAGTLSELVGPDALPQDVQLRTLGIRRAAERSLAVQTPESMAWLEAYAAGVNAYLHNQMFQSTESNEDCSSDGFSAESTDEGTEVVNALPIEYGPLEIDRNGIPDWTVLDSLTTAKGLAWQLSFDLEDIDRTVALQTALAVGDILGFNGLQLYTADLYAAHPFDPTISIPAAAPDPEQAQPAPVIGSQPGQVHDLMGGPASGPGDDDGDEDEYLPDFVLDQELIDQLREYRDSISDIPLLQNAVEGDYTGQGSNWFLAAGMNTVSGDAMIANDPHLGLTTPATFYEVHLQVKRGINAAGVSFPGVPGLVQGCNDTICWGSSVNPMDVTDVYQDVLLALGPNPLQPTHIFRADGPPEPLVFIPQQFFFNAIGDTVPNTLVDAMIPADSGGVTIVIPRRNDGPVVDLSVSAGPSFSAISVQYTGWGPTQELETFRRFVRAESTQDFEDALQFFDVGSQNWAYADIHGNIAYYTSGELPIREDLQNPPFLPAGLRAPSVIRDGTGTLNHDWQTLTNPQPNQSLSTEILPFNEMPQVVNPPSGIILNANNDPIGTTLDGVTWNQFRAGFNGRLYLSAGYAAGFRMGRIQRLFNDALAGGPMSAEQFVAIQANNQLLDAEVFTPFLLDAFANASVSATPDLAALAADPEIAEAIGRLAAWDFSTPTGIPGGFDPGDVDPFALPSQAEIDASVAATIYAAWRGQVVQRVIDQTLGSLPIPLDSIAPGSSQSLISLRRLLEAYPVNGGFGQSLINFFNEPGEGGGFFDRRDLVLLRGLRNALDLLASDEFAPAFGNSTNHDDYRWGKLHRIVFAHPLGGPFDIPPPGSPLNVAPDLPGVARAGGLGAVDASAHNARADGLHEYMFDSGPARRLVATMRRQGPEVLEVIPGGQSGAPGSPLQIDQLNLWLVNAFHPLPLKNGEVMSAAASCQTFVPMPDTPANEPFDPLPPATSDVTDPDTVHDLDDTGDTSRHGGRTFRRMSGRGR